MTEIDERKVTALRIDAHIAAYSVRLSLETLIEYVEAGETYLDLATSWACKCKKDISEAAAAVAALRAANNGCI